MKKVLAKKIRSSAESVATYNFAICDTACNGSYTCHCSNIGLSANTMASTFDKVYDYYEPFVNVNS